MTQDPAKLLAQADKAYSSASSWSWSSFASSSSEKLEKVPELYKKAGAAYRVKKEGREAGMAYEKAASIEAKIGESNDMANTLQDAFKAYRETCPEDAARCLSQAVDHFLDGGNFRRAATQKQALAELYEDIGDRSNARSAYEATAQWFEGDGAPALANRNNLKAAELAALDGDYLDAIRRFEHVAKLSLKSANTKYSVKKYLLQAGICHLALDVIGAKRALESYREIDTDFSSTEEYQLLAGLLEPVEQGDSEAFEGTLWQYYQKRSKPDSWHTDIYMKIKGQLELKEEDFS